MTLEGLRTFKVRSRRYRNRRIGEFLKELHLTEGRNTGFKKILNALKQNGSPLPEFETDEAHDYFITRLFIREGFYDYEDDEQHRSPIFEKGAKKGAKKGSKSEEVQRRIEDVYQAIYDNPTVKNSELESIVGATKRQIETAIKNASKQWTNSSGRWEQKRQMDN